MRYVQQFTPMREEGRQVLCFALHSSVCLILQRTEQLHKLIIFCCCCCPAAVCGLCAAAAAGAPGVLLWAHVTRQAGRAVQGETFVTCYITPFKGFGLLRAHMTRWCSS
jgi:hypothetical protein